MIGWFSAFVHDLVHQVAGLDYPDSHWWLDIAATLVFVVAPAWTGWLALRAGLRWLKLWRRRRARRRIIMSGRAIQVGHGLKPLGDAGVDEGTGWRLETYVVRATFRFQLRLVALSLLTLPAAWLLLEIPKHIINHALADANAKSHPEMTFLGLHLDRVELLVALCGSYLAVLTASGLTKYAANRVRGRVNERVVRRLRLAILRRARLESFPEQRATLAAVAIQEVEPVGYFGGSFVVVPLIQGGTFLTSIIFLLLQNVALALAALIMLPVQLILLPRLQERLNAKIRERVHATRALGQLMSLPPYSKNENRDHSMLARQIQITKNLESIRTNINDAKGKLKGLYNYTSSLTPFFFFAIGGYLVVQGRLSLGALVAALAAYREIAPALRELFDFFQSWSDARSRFEEVEKAVNSGGDHGNKVAI